MRPRRLLRTATLLSLLGSLAFFPETASAASRLPWIDEIIKASQERLDALRKAESQAQAAVHQAQDAVRAAERLKDDEAMPVAKRALETAKKAHDQARKKALW